MNLLLLTLAVLVTYLNATLSGAQIFDDITLIQTVQSADSPWALYRVMDNPKYFRPLGYMTFYLDLMLLGGDLVLTHVISVALHLCNAILVYFLGMRLVNDVRQAERVAMAAALLFALHPVQSESVVWLSARFDLLCCSFVLITLLLVLRRPYRISIKAQAAIFLVFLCSLLTKESSLFLPLCLLVFFIAERRSIPLRYAATTLAVLVLSCVTYLAMRGGLVVHDAPWGAFTECLAGFGFYLTKMINPFPLNFAITSLHRPTQLFLLLALYIPALVLLLRRMPQVRLPIALMSLALIPPLYAMMKGLPWVPYAERYLYIPMAGFAMLAACVLVHVTRHRSFFATLCLLLLIGFPTAQRVNLWGDHEAFWQDTIRKSPGFGTPHLVLAAEYLSENRLAEAEQQLAAARAKGIGRPDAVRFARTVQAALDASKNAQRRMLPQSVPSRQ